MKAMLNILPATLLIFTIAQASSTPASSSHPYTHYDIDRIPPPSSQQQHPTQPDDVIDPDFAFAWAYDGLPPNSTGHLHGQSNSAYHQDCQPWEPAQSAGPSQPSTWDLSSLEGDWNFNVDDELAALDRSIVQDEQWRRYARHVQNVSEQVYDLDMDDEEQSTQYEEDHGFSNDVFVVPAKSTDGDRDIIMKYWANLPREVSRDAIALAEATDVAIFKDMTPLLVTSVMSKYMANHEYPNDFIKKFKYRRYRMAKTKNSVPTLIRTQQKLKECTKAKIAKVVERMRRVGVELDGSIVELDKRLRLLPKNPGPYSYKTWYDAAMYYVAQNRSQEDAALLKRLRSDHKAGIKSN